ncbi:Spindle pole body protein pcp1 [Chionoecetes opilio]|uniref:Spindle pole body protein pcp1 n=1 Tax=Chionoecetes opilio TaxID=41210 RepID=A0A8J5C6S7_CHIOP|nr:Spindle pole body protein pcp1 [Chionoecetes opilio]
MDWVLGKVVDLSDCGTTLGNTKITDLVFADDAVIFVESLEVLVMALEALHEEAKPFGLENTVKQQVEEQEVELAKAKETNSHLSGERDAALEAVGEKDTLINTLKRQLEQAQDASAAYQREQRAVPKYVPGAMNIPGIEKKGVLYEWILPKHHIEFWGCPGAVTGVLVTCGAVTGVLVTCGAVTGVLVTCGAITGVLVTCGAVTGVLVTCGTVTGVLVTCGAVTGVLVTCGAVTGVLVTCGAVTGVLVTCGAVTGMLVTCGTVTGVLVTCGTVTGVLVTCGAVTGVLVTSKIRTRDIELTTPRR